jgi:MFS transporter, MHS family, proline/betaine transporter
MSAVGFYTLFVYAVTYLERIVHVRAAEALDLNTLSMGILLLVLPVAGTLSDRVGRKPLLLGSTLGMLALAWPLFWLMHHPVWSLMLMGQLGVAVLLGLCIGTLPATMAEAFPTRVRGSGVALSYNLCWGLLGGTAPIPSTAVVHLVDPEEDPCQDGQAEGSGRPELEDPFVRR